MEMSRIVLCRLFDVLLTGVERSPGMVEWTMRRSVVRGLWEMLLLGNSSQFVVHFCNDSAYKDTQ